MPLSGPRGAGRGHGPLSVFARSGQLAHYFVIVALPQSPDRDPHGRVLVWIWNHHDSVVAGVRATPKAPARVPFDFCASLGAAF
jgi:hypothetical protein